MSMPSSQKGLPQAAGRPEHARRIFLIVVIFAAFGIFGGIWSIKTSIEQPLAFTNSSTSVNTKVTTTADEDELISLKTKDTDQDGLTDYEELYTHGTSPYLKDSDSDGVEDKAEIDNGDDPNCPQGTTCTPIAIFSPSNNSNSSSNSNNNTNSNTDTEEIDVNALRVALRNAGASQTELDKLTDEELLTQYRALIQEESATNSNANSSANTSIDVSTIPFSELEALSVDEIRQLLVLGGAEESLVDNIDDDTLRTIYLESLQNLQSSN